MGTHGVLRPYAARDLPLDTNDNVSVMALFDGCQYSLSGGVAGNSGTSKTSNGLSHRSCRCGSCRCESYPPLFKSFCHLTGEGAHHRQGKEATALPWLEMTIQLFCCVSSKLVNGRISAELGSANDMQLLGGGDDKLKLLTNDHTVGE